MARIRIVGGTLSGRRFEVPVHEGTRPTSERVREALASALQSRGAFENARVLDLFAGTGALAFEALSRGASAAVLVERDRKVVRGLRKSARDLGVEDRVTILSLDAFKAKAQATIAEEGPFDLVFLDPPYASTDRLGEALGPLLPALRPEAWVVVEHGGNPPDPATLGLALEASYRYGDTAIELLSVPSPPESTSA